MSKTRRRRNKRHTRKVLDIMPAYGTIGSYTPFYREEQIEKEYIPIWDEIDMTKLPEEAMETNDKGSKWERFKNWLCRH